MPEEQPQNATSKLSPLMNLQFAWFLGHFITVISAVLFFFSIFSSSFVFFYKQAFLGVIISYGITIYKLFGPPEYNKKYWMKVCNDENIQYLILGIFWMISPPLLLLIIPYAFFSIFHVLEYCIDVLYPLYLPNPTDSQKALVEKIRNFVTNYQPISVQFNAKLEVCGIFPLLVFLVILRRASFIQPFIFALFLHFRYSTSPLIQKEFAQLRLVLDSKLLGNEKIPQGVQDVYVKVRDFVIKIGSYPIIDTNGYKKE